MNNEEKLVELMSLMLDELREIKQEQREMKQEMKIVNDRLGALEYAVLNDTRELRARVERLEARVGKIEHQ